MRLSILFCPEKPGPWAGILYELLWLDKIIYQIAGLHPLQHITGV